LEKKIFFSLIISSTFTDVCPKIGKENCHPKMKTYDINMLPLQQFCHQKTVKFSMQQCEDVVL
jgi:hypothetical protein